MKKTAIILEDDGRREKLVGRDREWNEGGQE